MKNKVFQFILLFITWVVLSWSLSLPEVLLGLFACALVTYITARLFEGFSETSFDPAKSLWFAVYLAFIIWDSFKAGFDALLRLAAPDTERKPKVIEVRTELKGIAAIEILANTLSLLPGTLAAEADPERGVINVHCMALKNEFYTGSIELSLKKYENILRKVYE